MGAPTIRAAQPQDAEALAALSRLVEGAPHWPAYVFASLSTHPAKLLLVLEGEVGLGGYVVAALIPAVPPEAELEAVAVLPRLQRQGHGHALLRAMLHWAARHGAARVLLAVRASNHPARQLYLRHGFVPCGRRPRYYQAPEEDALLMERVRRQDDAG